MGLFLGCKVNGGVGKSGLTKLIEINSLERETFVTRKTKRNTIISIVHNIVHNVQVKRMMVRINEFQTRYCEVIGLWEIR